MKYIWVCFCVLIVFVWGVPRGSHDVYAMSGPPADEGKLEMENNGDSELSPDFVLKSMDKETVVLSSYRGKKPVILFFWTTWCENCRAGMKLLDKKNAQLLNDNFEVFAVNVGESESKVARFVNANNLRFKVVLDPDAQAARSFELIGVPTYIIVDTQGRIRFYNNYLPYEDLSAICR